MAPKKADAFNFNEIKSWLKDAVQKGAQTESARPIAAHTRDETISGIGILPMNMGWKPMPRRESASHNSIEML
jgi:hypothetical protein